MPVGHDGRARRTTSSGRSLGRAWGPAAVAVLLFLLGSCSGPSTQNKPALTGVQSYAQISASGQVGSIQVEEAWIPPPPGRSYPPGSGVALGMVLVNRGSSWDRLTSVTTPVASQVSVSQYNIVQDFISLTTDPRTVSSAGQLEDTTETITPGQRVPVTFTFSSAGSLTLDVPVRKAPSVGIGPK